MIDALLLDRKKCRFFRNCAASRNVGILFDREVTQLSVTFDDVYIRNFIQISQLARKFRNNEKRCCKRS